MGRLITKEVYSVDESMEVGLDNGEAINLEEV